MAKQTDITQADNLFSESRPDLHPFKFNQAVVDVFPDMINRSVPGYQTIIDGIGKIAKKLLPNAATVYDLGCSTGSVSLSIAKQCKSHALTIHAIDNSQAMVERCEQYINTFNYPAHIKVNKGDITKLSLDACDMVVINFTLQFIAPEERQAVIDTIFSALKSGGILVISEKFKASEAAINDTLSSLHHDFKRENGYSELEISQKRSALEDVMILDDFQTHFTRLQKAGFSNISPWFQHFNFFSFFAIKP
jgi:tRNA (cmo5U34)-methyltransferase